MLGCFADSVNTTNRRFFPKLPAMDLRDSEKRLNALPRGARSRLAKRLSIDTSTVTKVFKAKRRLQLGEPETIEQFLLEEEAALSGKFAPSIAPAGMVPVYGYVAAEGELLSLSESQVLRNVPLHPAQQGYAKVGAAEVIGESMFPRYKARELVYFVFELTPRRGEDVVAEIEDGRAILKEYVMRKDGRVFLREYSPQERMIDYPDNAIKALHAVVGRG